jgi:sec-independent protein translocase protein TatA
MAPLLAIFGIGSTELLIFLFVVLILFGSRLPSLMRNMGRSAVEFKKGLHELDDDEETVRRESKGT